MPFCFHAHLHFFSIDVGSLDDHTGSVYESKMDSMTWRLIMAQAVLCARVGVFVWVVSLRSSAPRIFYKIFGCVGHEPLLSTAKHSFFLK